MFDLALLIVCNEISVDSKCPQRALYAMLKPCVMLASLVAVSVLVVCMCTVSLGSCDAISENVILYFGFLTNLENEKCLIIRLL